MAGGRGAYALGMRRRLRAWLEEASNLRTFAWLNVWFWFVQHFVVTAWYLLHRQDFGGIGLGGFYLIHISIAALWLSSLAWWQSTRVEERQIEAEES